MKTLLKIIGLLAIVSLLMALSFLAYDYLKTRGAFPAKTYIGQIDVSHLTVADAVAKLKAYPLTAIFAPLITLETDSRAFSFLPQQLGLSLLYNQTVRQAFKATHQGNYFEELKDRMPREVFVAPLVLAIDKNQLLDLLKALAPTIETTAKDASLTFYEETGGYHIEPEEVGRKINFEKTVKDFEQALSEGKIVIPISIEYAYPKIREAVLRANPPAHRLSAYTTYYGSHDSPNRIHNIQLVASWINGTLLMPGETFSVAKVLGNVTEEKGFKKAFVIVGGELVPLLGGGSCQIATTLYNTVQLADLKVLQRRNHSFYFNIYPLGRDAGVYPGQLDFRFENDSGYPVIIKSVATDKKLSFRIYGTPSGKTVKFSPATILGINRAGKFVSMTLRQVINLDIPFKTFITRTVYDKDGKAIETETIPSYYKLYGDKTNVPVRRAEPR